MNLKPLSAALLGAGIAVVGTAGAIDLRRTGSSATARRRRAGRRSKPAPAEQRRAAGAAGTPVPGQVPNYRAIVKQSAPAVVGITVEGTHKACAEEQPGLPPGMEDDPFFKFFRGIPGSASARPPEPADAVQGHGLGLHHQLRRPDPDQRARRARRQGRHRQAERPARVHRQGARHRHRDRHRRAAHRRQGPAGGPPRRPEEPRGRRPGARDRRALRPRADRDLRASSAPRAARCRATRSCPSSRPTRR